MNGPHRDNRDSTNVETGGKCRTQTPQSPESAFIGVPAEAAPRPNVTKGIRGASITVEILRRIVFQGGLLAALLLAVWPRLTSGQPLTNQAGGCAGLALLGYILLPWPPRGPKIITHSRGSAIIGPDVLGFILGTFFFMLPLLIINDHVEDFSAAKLFDVEDGWIWLTVVMWSLASISYTIVFVALAYACFAIHLLDDRFVRFTIFGRTEWRYADTARVEEAYFAFPAWIRVTAFILGLCNWALMGAVVSGVLTERHGIRLHGGQGRTLTLWADHIPEFPRLMDEMLRAGIVVDDSLRETRSHWFPNADDS